MILEKIPSEFSICKVDTVDEHLLNTPYTFFSRTDNELSLICLTENVPAHTNIVEHGWRCFRIAEDASFEKYGMIAYLTQIIANEKTGVLVVATFDTDYLFVKSEKYVSVCEALERDGCKFLE